MVTGFDLIGAVPFARAAGIEESRRIENGVTLRLPYSARMSDGRSGSLHAGAVAGLIDHAMGGAIIAARPHPGRLSTVDMRIDWLADMAPGDGAVARATRSAGYGDFHLVDCLVTDERNGRLVARARGNFLHSPPLAIGSGEPASPAQSHFPWSDFPAFLGLRRDGLGSVLPPAPHLLGNVDLPALHGGMICAALIVAGDAAARHMPDAQRAMLKLCFMRPVRGDFPSDIQIEPVRIGRRTGWFSATLHQAGTVEVAADLLFARTCKAD